MRIAEFAAVAGVVLLTIPAQAQTAASPPHAQPGQQQSGASNAVGSNAATSNAAPQVSEPTRQQIRQSLEQSGFKNVHVMPELFLVRATARDGGRIVMQVGPDQIAAVIEPTAGSGNLGSGNLGSGTAGSGTAGTGSGAATSGASAGTSGSTQGSGTGPIAQQIRHSMEQNGFTNVEVIPQAFVIRAQAPDGSRMVMEVSPEETEAVFERGGQAGSTGTSGTPGGLPQPGNNAGPAQGRSPTGR